jgi:hypothetical protein
MNEINHGIELGVLIPIGQAQWGPGVDPRSLVDFAVRSASAQLAPEHICQGSVAPAAVGDIARAALVLVQSEHKMIT